MASTAAVVLLHRFGTLKSVNLVFRGNSLPATLRVGLVWHEVQLYVPRLLQLLKCMKLWHLIRAFSYKPICCRCIGKHASDPCTSIRSKCANWSRDHCAT